MNDYRNFLNEWLSAGYSFVDFGKNKYLKYEIIMRHDVDFCPSFALKMAKIEEEFNIKSTYFFLLSNASYNMLTAENIEVIKSIEIMGHTVSIHFDETVDNDIEKRFKLEYDIFKSIFSDINIISLHKPRISSLNTELNFYNNIESAYQKKYFSEIEYYADSGNDWRYGDPLKSSAFHAREPFQILTHPVWWFECSSGRDSVKEYFNNKMNNHVDSLLTPKGR